MCECVCYCAYFYYVNKLYVHVCVLERAKHSFFALPNPLSCSVMNKICLNQENKTSKRMLLVGCYSCFYTIWRKEEIYKGSGYSTLSQSDMYYKISSSSCSVLLPRVGCNGPPFLVVLCLSDCLVVFQSCPFSDVCCPLRSRSSASS